MTKEKRREKTCCPCNMVAWQLAVNRASPTSLKMTGGLATLRRWRIKYGETANRAGCLVKQRRKKIADQDGLSDDRRQTWRPFNPNPLCVPKQMTKRRKANKSKQEKFEKMIRQPRSSAERRPIETVILQRNDTRPLQCIAGPQRHETIVNEIHVGAIIHGAKTLAVRATERRDAGRINRVCRSSYICQQSAAPKIEIDSVYPPPLPLGFFFPFDTVHLSQQKTGTARITQQSHSPSSWALSKRLFGMEPNNRFGVKFSTASVQFAQFEARDFQLSESNIRALQLLAVKTHFLVLVQISPNAFAKWFAPENVCRSSERQTANTRQ